MSEGEVRDPVGLVAARLQVLGLDHSVIDPAATHADLVGRIEQSASLDALVSEAGGLDPTAFDPGWPADESQRPSG